MKLRGEQGDEEHDFFHLQGLGGVGCIQNQSFATQVGDGLGSGLGNQLVLGAFAAHDDDDVLVGEFDHGHGVVYSEVSDVAFAAGQIGAQFVGVFLVVVDDFDAVFREEALLVGDDKLNWAPQ